MYSMGIDLGGTNIAGGIVDGDGNIIMKKSVPTGASRSADEIICDIAALCRSLCGESGINLGNIEAVGIAVPGGVSPDTGTVIFTPNIPFSGINISKLLSDKLDGKKILLSNDANAAALAEALYGVGAGAKNAVMITLGTGVGGGIVIDGKLYTGANGLAGELGHFTVEKDGVLCGCGNRGCFEVYCSATALSRMTREELEKCRISGEDTLMAGKKADARSAFNAFRLGDRAAVRVIEKYTDYLAVGISSLINIFQPEVFIIGGGVSGEGDFLTDLLQPKVKALDFAKNHSQRTRLAIAKLGNDAGIIGAAMAY